MLRTLSITLGGAATIAAGVTTLRFCGEFWDSIPLAEADGLIFVYNLVWCLCLTGDVNNGWTRASVCLFSAAFGAVVVYWTGGLLIFFVNKAATFVSTVIVSSQIVEKGTSEWGWLKLSVIYWDAIMSCSVEDICGIRELWGKIPKCTQCGRWLLMGYTHFISIMMHGSAQWVPGLAMGWPYSPLWRIFVCNDLAYWKSKCGFVIINQAVVMRRGR